MFKLQKRAAFVFLNTDMRESSSVLFERLHWLPQKDEINLLKSKLIFRRITEAEFPSYTTELLPRISDSHNRLSRYTNYNLMCPRYN